MWYRRIFRLVSNAREAQRGRGEGKKVPFHLDAPALRQLDRLQIRGSKSLRGDRIGLRASHRGKPAAEFREHRMYVPGDDIRFLDWRASGRHEQIFIRYGEMPKDVIVHILIDCSASMVWGKKSKRESQMALAAALGYLALTNSDRLYVYPYGSRHNPEFGLASGKGRIGSYVRYLSQLRYGGISDLEEAVRIMSKRTARGGVVFILSDLLEKGNLSNILDAIPAPKWWVNILHLLHPAELAPELLGAYELEDSETGVRVNYDLTRDAIRRYRLRLENWQNQLELTAVEHHAFYSVVNTDWALSQELLPYLRERQILVSD